MNQTPKHIGDKNANVLPRSSARPRPTLLESSGAHTSLNQTSVTPMRVTSELGMNSRSRTTESSIGENGNCQVENLNREQNEMMIVDRVPRRGNVFSDTSDPDDKVQQKLSTLSRRGI